VTHSKLPAMIKAARTLRTHLDNIVTYARLRITNALGESLNRACPINSKFGDFDGGGSIGSERRTGKH